MTETTTETPTLPADPGARAIYADWYKTLDAVRSAEQDQRPAPEPDQRALRKIAATQGEINTDTGRRFYDESSRFRETVERLRVEALEGRFDEAAARRALAEALGRPVKDPPAPVAPVGSPEDRAIEAAFRPADQLPPETWQGFEPVTLPAGVQVNAEALSPYLIAAREAGLSQNQVNTFVAGMADSEAAADDAIVQYTDAASLGREDWAGYSPVRLPAGLTVDRDDFREKLTLAREAGLSQDQLAAGLAAYISQLA